MIVLRSKLDFVSFWYVHCLICNFCFSNFSNTSHSVEDQEQRVLDQAADFERRFHISADDESNSRRDSLVSSGPVCIWLNLKSHKKDLLANPEAYVRALLFTFIVPRTLWNLRYSIVIKCFLLLAVAQVKDYVSFEMSRKCFS